MTVSTHVHLTCVDEIWVLEVSIAIEIGEIVLNLLSGWHGTHQSQEIPSIFFVDRQQLVQYLTEQWHVLVLSTGLLDMSIQVPLVDSSVLLVDVLRADKIGSLEKHKSETESIILVPIVTSSTLVTHLIPDSR